MKNAAPPEAPRFPCAPRLLCAPRFCARRVFVRAEFTVRAAFIPPDRADDGSTQADLLAGI